MSDAQPTSDLRVAALFVQTDGCYFGLPDVDPWDKARDARLYAGPWRVVAHPPCERWGRYWSGGPSARVRRRKGDDEGCFAAALASVRRWGGFSPDLGIEGVKYTEAPELDKAIYAVFKTRRQARKVYACVRPVQIVVPEVSEKDEDKKCTP